MTKENIKLLIEEVILEMESDIPDPQFFDKPSSFKFRNFNWMGNQSGFDVPEDVYFGAIYIGTIYSKPEGYAIWWVDVPSGGGKAKVNQNPRNIFKTKIIAADALYRLWVHIRKHGLQR